MSRNIKIPVECYSRVVGYFRPVSNWNNGKKSEWEEKIFLNIDYSEIDKKLDVQ